jgi:spore maturation protein CgeB
MTAGFRDASAWAEELKAIPLPDGVEEVPARRGDDVTLRIGGTYLHSRYNPREEAQRLIASAKLQSNRPVLVVGIGLGYHVEALLEEGFSVTVAEHEPGIVGAALRRGLPLENLSVALGAPELLAEDPAFQAFARQTPQVLVYPPSAKLQPDYAAGITRALSRAALGGQRLGVAVVGPLYGGSLPIAGYLADAFESLGHRVKLVDNSMAWPMYQAATQETRTPQAAQQLGNMLGTFLAEWTYARVAEFNPEICIVLAQAPVAPNFPERLAKHGILTGFWYVENWRHLPYWQELASRYDYFFHIQPGAFEDQLTQAGCAHHAFVQTGCAPEKHHPVALSAEESATYTCDLSFAGAGYYNRIQFFQGLTDYDFRIWGVDWADRELSRHVVGGEKRFDSETFMKIVAGSRINLNLHSSTTAEGVDAQCDALNPRVFEIAAAGGFQICDPCIGLDRHFDTEDEVPVYRDLKSCRTLIEHYLKNPDERKAIAKRAQERALAEHTYAHRAQQMLDLLLEAHGARLLKRGVRVERTVTEVADRLPEADDLAAWLRTLPEDTLFTHDNVSPLLGRVDDNSPRPARILAYMHEVKEFADALLKEPR